MGEWWVVPGGGCGGCEWKVVGVVWCGVAGGGGCVCCVLYDMACVLCDLCYVWVGVYVVVWVWLGKCGWMGVGGWERV